MKLKDFDKKDVTITGTLFYLLHDDEEDIITISTKYIMDDWVLPPGLYDLIDKKVKFNEGLTLRYICNLIDKKLYVRGYVATKGGRTKFNYYIPLGKNNK